MVYSIQWSRKIKILRGPNPTNLYLTSKSYCLVCLTQISSWVIIGWAGPLLLKYWGAPPPVPTPMVYVSCMHHVLNLIVINAQPQSVLYCCKLLSLGKVKNMRVDYMLMIYLTLCSAHACMCALPSGCMQQ